MSGGFAKDERRFGIGLRKETYELLAEVAEEEHDMSIGTYVSWKMEEHAREVRAARERKAD